MWKTFLTHYSKDFVLFTAICIVLASAIFITNNFSHAPSKRVLLETTKDSSVIAQPLVELEEHFSFYTSVLPSILAHQVDLPPPTFLLDSDLVSDYFFYTNTPEHSALSPMLDEIILANNALIQEQLTADPRITWFTFPDTEHNFLLTYIAPLMNHDEYIGYVGLLIDGKTLAYSVHEYFENTSRKYALLDNQGNILVSSEYDYHKRSDPTDENTYGKWFETIQNADGSGSFMTYSPQAVVHAFVTLPTGQILVESQDRFTLMLGLNFLLLNITIAAIFCSVLIQKNKKDNQTLLDSITAKLMKRYINTLTSPEQNAAKSVIAFSLAILGVLASYFFYYFVTNASGLATFTNVVIFMITFYVLRSFRKEVPRKRLSIIFVVLFLIIPLLLHWLYGGYAVETGRLMIWMIAGIILALFLLGSNSATKAFYAFVILLLLNVFIEISFFHSVEYQKIFGIVISLYFLGFACFATIELFVEKSKNDYKVLERLFVQVKDTQSLLVQKEKMVVLGQLVASVAHEINTPMGAIKASSENMTASFDFALKNLMQKAKTFSEDDYLAFNRLLHMANEAVLEMKSTTNMRRSKKVLREYFITIELEDYDAILSRLSRLEITTEETIYNNMDLFKRENILVLLDAVCDIAPLITGTQTILFATNKISKIVFAMKSYSHTSLSNDPTLFDLIKNIENVLTLYHNQLKADVTIIREYAKDIPPILGNSDEIGQVWTNLIQNAMYAMENGGTLTIRIDITDHNFITVSIQDTGTGIEQENLNKIFDPFYTTKPSGEGSGLGLDITKKIITKHDGTISAESTKNVGTKFIVTLPINSLLITSFDH